MRVQLARAIHFYVLAGHYRLALSLAKQLESDHDIVSIAMQGDPVVANEAAEYFETRGMTEQAALLYHKGRNFSQAIEMCIQGKLGDTLARIGECIGVYSSDVWW